MASERLVLVGNDKGGDVSVLRLVDDALQEVARNPVGLGCSTFAVDGERDLVYVAVKEPDPAVVVHRLDRHTGLLTEVSRRDVDDPLAYLSLSGDVLLGASYHGGWGAAWPVSDGVVGEPASRVTHRNLHCAVADPSGKSAYFVSLGEDLVAQFAIGAGGALTELAQPTVACPPGSGPRHLIVAADGRSAYLVTEFTGEVFRFDRADDGSLSRAESVAAHDDGLGTSALGRDPRAEHLVWGADLAVVGQGRWLVSSERTASTLAVIPLEDTGHLGGEVLLSPTQEQPRGLTVSPDGSRIIVVGERSGAASLYRIEDGALVELHQLETGVGPNWVRFI